MARTKVRFVTFNVCGIKGILSRAAQWVPERNLEAMFDHLGGDVICFQETKIQSTDITKDMAIVPHFKSYFTSSSGRKGYSGVVIYVRNNIRVHKAEEGLTGMLPTGPPGNSGPYRYKPQSFHESVYPPDMKESYGRRFDEQGRVLTLDIGSCVIIGLYCPADSQGNMGEYREEFYQLLDWRVSKLREMGREVIVLGDLNVARESRDSAPLRDECKRSGIRIAEDEWKYGTVPRTAVNQWIEQLGFVDTSRKFHEGRPDMYTCWDISKNCRPANFGSRIDYVLVSSGIECVDGNIMPDLIGSDHCPVYADVLLEIEPQAPVKTPYLNRAISERWNNSITSFFQPKASKRKAEDSATRSDTLVDSPAESTQLSPKRLNSEKVSVKREESAIEEINASKPVNTSEPTVPGPIISDSAPETTIPKASAVPTSPQKKAQKGQLSLSQLFATKDTKWHKVSHKLIPPMCQHNEPCIPKVSGKPPRKGETFWMCGRPMGGKTNKGRESRCGTFIWDTERN